MKTSWLTTTCLFLFASHLSAAPVLHEMFADNPIGSRALVSAGDAARFQYDSGGVTAAYDTSASTAKLAWPLERSIDAAQSFQLNVRATLLANALLADPNGFAQLAFGLVNATTGADRAGGAGGDAYDVVTVDYFPNVSPLFGGPTLAPTVIGSDQGGGFFSSIQFPFGNESALDDEGSLPLDTPLEFSLNYAAETSLLTLRVAVNGQALPINANRPEIEPGGFDGDPATIQLQLSPATAFRVDQFAILLWEDTFLAPGASPSVAAKLRFEEIRLELPATDLEGDTNGDGIVNIEDLNNVRNSFGQAGGDLVGDTYPHDGAVNIDDLNRVRNNFGVGNNVPEPASMSLAAAALVSLLYHGWRTRLRQGTSACPTIDRLDPPPSGNTIAGLGMRG